MTTWLAGAWRWTRKVLILLLLGVLAGALKAVGLHLHMPALVADNAFTGFTIGIVPPLLFDIPFPAARLRGRTLGVLALLFLLLGEGYVFGFHLTEANTLAEAVNGWQHRLLSGLLVGLGMSLAYPLAATLNTRFASPTPPPASAMGNAGNKGDRPCPDTEDSSSRFR